MEPLDLRRWDGHLLLVHRDERERRAGVTAWTVRGLEVGAKIVYFEPRQESADRAFLNVLREGGLDVGGPAARGQLEVVTVGTASPGLDWLAGRTDDALAAGYSTVRLASEASTSWNVLSHTSHARAELLADELCRSRPVSVLCQYSAAVTGSILQTACRAHTAGLRGPGLATFPAPGGVALAGEVDASNAGLLRAALMAATARGAPGWDAFLVDLAGLDYASVAAARALVSGTTAYRLKGGVVRLHAAGPLVGELLRLVGIDRVDGFVMEEAG